MDKQDQLIHEQRMTNNFLKRIMISLENIDTNIKKLILQEPKK
jgi:hypothetical protein